ncbi:MAG: hypothetical protein OSA82_10320, partial [Paracoccaceae bacterium]|nr:hypothetical protein [Paracoccaceae bacterium]
CCSAISYSQAATAVVIPIPVVRFTKGTTAATALQSAWPVADGFTTGADFTVSVVILAGLF